MKTDKKIWFGMIFLIGMLIFASGDVSAYLTSNAAYTSGATFNYGYSGSWISDESMCEAGQDFIIQIAPFGCTPAVVRSDLLEEQNVPVYCQLAATKINPLIDVNAIESIHFSGETPAEVSGIGFHPAKAALGVEGDLNSPVLENIGYAVIVLKQQEKESEMPDFVQGNLTAEITYDIENAYGIGKATFYLPYLTNLEWEEKKNQYSFWDGKGYLKADGISSNGASVSIYDGETRKITTVNLEKGQSSQKIYLPGFDCLAGLELRLDGLENPDTRAKLDINGQIVEVAEGEEFLEGRCSVRKLDKVGLVERVEIRCREDKAGFFGGSSFELTISPRIELTIDGKKDTYEIGDYLYDDGDKRVYLGYANTFGNTNKEKDLYVYFIAIPASINKDKLTAEEILSLARYDKGWVNERTSTSLAGMGDWILGKIGSNSINLYKWAVDGENIRMLSFEEGGDSILGKDVQIHGYAEPEDIEFKEEILQDYDNAAEDYDKVINSYPTEKIQDGFDEITSGEESLYRKIKLAFDLGQEKTVAELCDEFEKKYTDSKKNMNRECKDAYKLSSSEISTTDIMINSEARRISLEGIYEPTLDEYGATIFIKGTGGKMNEVSLTKNQIYYLDELRGEGEVVYSSSRTGELGYLLRFSFISGSWKWSIDGKNWNEISETKIPPESYSYASSMFPNIVGNLKLNTNDVELLNKLNGVSFTTGNRILEAEGFARSIGEEYIQLVGLDDDSAQLVYNVHEKGFWSTAKALTISNERGTLKKNTPESFGSDFIFTLTNINLKKSAKVSVIPSISNAGTEVNFSFKIGIEKRAIQLSPEKTREKIENLEESIGKWEKKSESLGNVVKGLKGACLATGTYLIVKNFLAGTDGMATARATVMRMEGGWNDKCSAMVQKGTYKTLDECFAKEADNIDRDVEQYYNAMKKQNDEIKNLEKGYEGSTSGLSSIFGERNYDTKKFMEEAYVPEVKKELNENIGDRKIKVDGQEVEASEVIGMISADTVTVEQLRSLQLNSRVGSDITLKQLDKDLAEIYVNSKDTSERTNFIEEINKKAGLKNIGFDYGRDKDAQEKVYNGGTATNFGEIKGTDVPVMGFEYAGTKYLLELENYKETEYSVKNVYTTDGIKVSNSAELAEGINKDFYFKKYDEKTYDNPYESSISDPKKPVLRYYETEPYEGLPALVPFDLDNGWYASIKQTLPILGNIQTYDSSGKVTSFYVCNVGENRKEEDRGGDDICELINTGTGQPYNQFYGLSESQATKVVKCAVDAIEDASRQYGNKNVKISTSCDSFSIAVGEPAVDVPDIQCQDFMSPTECKWLFNVCDPVICPSSRCDFGGTYHVKDVIQSGIIGSIALCLPNIREGIYIPVCLTGIKAGIDSYLSVLEAHRDCLQDSLENGEMVGICDEIYSINLCEFFWRQSLPLAQIAVPKITEWILGQNVHGGGEYLGVQAAWKNAEDSVTYFTEYYAANSYAAFKARSAETIGSEICKSYVSGVYPEGGNLLDSLTEPDSPPQYFGRFDEIPFTTATNPPISQYKVYYHIYAGKDSRAYYQVYLTTSAESSFYQDTSYRKIVASGYIAKGDYASETKDFTAPSGYTKMCIVVNGQEECGFEQVSTSFAVNYVEDEYLAEQASSTDIKTESECISGSASLYSLLNPNIQSAAEEILDPAIYENGIIRICATKNPGTGTDTNAEGEGSRWVDVGYCGDENIRCWLDMDSVKNVIENTEIEADVLNKTSANYLEILMNKEGYLSRQEVVDTIDEIQDKGAEEKIKVITDIFEKVFWNDQKARLLLMRGDSYGELAKSVFNKKVAEKIKTNETEETETGTTLTEFSKGGQENVSADERDCKKVLGEKIIEIAKQIKKEKGIDDSKVKSDTGAKNFECLVLMQAYQESLLQHCKEDKKGDCLYCDGDLDNVLQSAGDEASYGIMQINTKAHPNINVKDFEENVNYGINYLIQNYADTTMSYGCNGKNYAGWQLALRRYNGWYPSDCSKGDKNYVENVIGRKDEIQSLFPEECGE